MQAKPENLVLVGYTQKPFGLLGEVKVRPATFDLDRHAQLHTVYFKKRDQDEPETLEVRSSRGDGENWFLKFEGRRTPESVVDLSGGLLFVAAKDRLELPEDMVYLSDLPGMQVVDMDGRPLGTVKEVLDGVQELLVVQMAGKEIHLPWNEHFVKRIDREARQVWADLSSLEGLL